MPESTDVPQNPPTPDAPTKTLLVVDDSPSIRTLLRISLRKYPVRVILAEDGLDAWEILQDETPDLILMDLMMPRMDGLTLLDKIRADDRLAGTRCVVLSSRRDDETYHAAFGKGVFTYLLKPVSVKDLEPVVQELLDSDTTTA